MILRKTHVVPYLGGLALKNSFRQNPWIEYVSCRRTHEEEMPFRAGHNCRCFLPVSFPLRDDAYMPLLENRPILPSHEKTVRKQQDLVWYIAMHSATLDGGTSGPALVATTTDAITVEGFPCGIRKVLKSFENNLRGNGGYYSILYSTSSHNILNL